MNLKAILLIVFLVIGCSNDHKLIGSEEAFKFIGAKSRPATITTSKFINGRLTINGNCYVEDRILLVLPDTEKDNRIIGSPKCSNGKYEVISSKFGRPPCAVVVDYGGSKIVSAKVEGTEIYCP
jgi:hypothetical protein